MFVLHNVRHYYVCTRAGMNVQIHASKLLGTVTETSKPSFWRHWLTINYDLLCVHSFNFSRATKICVSLATFTRVTKEIQQLCSPFYQKITFRYSTVPHLLKETDAELLGKATIQEPPQPVAYNSHMIWCYVILYYVYSTQSHSHSISYQQTPWSHLSELACCITWSQ